MSTIWIFNHYAITPSIGGGTRHYDFAKELVKRENRVFVFASSFLHNNYSNLLNDTESFKVEKIDGIDWVWVNTRAYNNNGLNRITGMFQYYKILNKIYKHFDTPDVIIGSSVHPLACVAGIRIAAKTGAKSISEIRDLWPETLIKLGRINKHGFTAFVMHLLERYIYTKSEKIIITSPGMIDYFVDMGIKEDKIRYINNGVDVAGFYHNKDSHSMEETGIAIERGKFNICYVGAHGMANGLDTIIKAAKILQDQSKEVVFHFVGDGTEKLRLVELSKTMQLNNCNFYKPVSKELIPKIISSMDSLVFTLIDSPMWNEGLSSNKLFDYLCSGVPIIFSAKTYPNYVEDNQCGITVEPENPNAIAEAVLKLYEMTTQDRKEMGSRGQLFMEVNFNIPILVDKLEEVVHL